jgi:hypothetical protein
MPNYCENELDVSGKIEDIREFAGAVYSKKSDDEEEDTLLSFQKIKPRPEDQNDNWYDWNINNWGTKWGAIDVRLITSSNKRYTYEFSTAWSPPIKLVIEASRLYPKLAFTIRFWEGGMGFRGYVKCKNGEVVKEATYDYQGDRGG